MSSEPEKLPNGTVISGRYTIEKCLGSGGMGAVYLATDSFMNGDRVAMKVLHSDLVADPKQSQRFMREVQLMRKVDHPNVVRTYDVGTDDNIVFFTMEYVAGKSLEAFIDGQNFPKERIPQLIIEVASGLEAIHRANIIHRDLKPANILVLDSFQSKITDFGVARPEYSELTAHNEIIGSALYIAPEIWLGTKLTSSVDLYSLGVVLYELTTGVMPFDGDSPAALMRMHLEFKPTVPKELNPEIPVWLNKLILNLLAKTPEERMRDATDLIYYVEAQINRAQAKPATEDKFIDALESEASKFQAASAIKPASPRAVQKIEPKGPRTFGQEIIATLACLVIVGTVAGLLGIGINFLIKNSYPELISTVVDPLKLNALFQSALPLSSGFLLLLGAKGILSGASFFIPIGAAGGSLKLTIRLFIFGLVFSSLLVLVYLIYALLLASSTESQLLISNPNGFSAVLSAIHCATANLTFDPQAWNIQQIGLLEGTLYLPERSSMLSGKLSSLFQLVPVLVLSTVACRVAKFSFWALRGVALTVAVVALLYFSPAAETGELLRHSNPFIALFVLLIYSTIILVKRLFVK